MRKSVAQNVAASAQSAVHVTLTLEVDMTRCVELRKQLLPFAEEKYGLKISFMDLITKATCQALLDKPIVNSALRGDQIVLFDHVNIGIAASVEKRARGAGHQGCSRKVPAADLRRNQRSCCAGQGWKSHC